MSLPAPVNRALAEAAVDEFLRDESWQRRVAEYGWQLDRPGLLTIIVTLRARPLPDVSDLYTLRLECGYYPTHPADVRFVNPDTLEYDAGKDKSFLAVLEAGYCRVHPSYNYQDPYPYGPQLVCSSMTLGYYFSRHAPTEDQRWRPGRHSIGSSIYTVHRALWSPNYRGRHKQ
jgi:hypothetical protein